MPPQFFDHSFDYLIIISIQQQISKITNQHQSPNINHTEIAAIIYDIRQSEVWTNNIFYTQIHRQIQPNQDPKEEANNNQQNGERSLEKCDQLITKSIKPAVSNQKRTVCSFTEACSQLNNFLQTQNIRNFATVSVIGKDLKQQLKKELLNNSPQIIKQSQLDYLFNYIDLQSIFPRWLYPKDCDQKPSLEQMLTGLEIVSECQFQSHIIEEIVNAALILQKLEANLIKFTKNMMKKIQLKTKKND